MFGKGQVRKKIDKSPPTALDTEPLSDVSVIDEMISDRAVAPDKRSICIFP